MFLNKKNNSNNECCPPSLDLMIAKSIDGHGGAMDVYSHCYIVGLVAKKIIQRHAYLQNYLPDGAEIIAAYHDVGKVYPYFQKKLQNACDTNEFINKLECIHTPNLDENQFGFHAGVGQIALDDMNIGKYIPKIVGGHHGWKGKLKKQTGISSSQIYDYKRRGKLPSIDVVEKLAEYLQVSVDVLLGNIPNRPALGDLVPKAKKNIESAITDIANTTEQKQVEVSSAISTLTKSYAQQYPIVETHKSTKLPTLEKPNPKIQSINRKEVKL